ncbi:hypothetical protein AB6F62_09900 [Providencia huaxiensis]|uniref:hypothetical protein n=1 Tax=Providencia huaxiensis TaxID=2027290 RepID=UPI0034DCD4E3
MSLLVMNVILQSVEMMKIWLYEKLKVFIEQEFIHCDGLMPKKDKPEQGMIPYI